MHALILVDIPLLASGDSAMKKHVFLPVVIGFIFLSVVFFMLLWHFVNSTEALERLSLVATVSLATVTALPLIAISALLYRVAVSTDETIREQVKANVVAHERDVLNSLETELEKAGAAFHRLAIELLFFYVQLTDIGFKNTPKQGTDGDLDLKRLHESFIDNIDTAVNAAIGRLRKALTRVASISIANRILSEQGNTLTDFIGELETFAVCWPKNKSSFGKSCTINKKLYEGFISYFTQHPFSTFSKEFKEIQGGVFKTLAESFPSKSSVKNHLEVVIKRHKDLEYSDKLIESIMYFGLEDINKEKYWFSKVTPMN